MKAITLWQPWASLIADGRKTVETRSWAPPKALIGHRIAIHASKRAPIRGEWSPQLQALIDLWKRQGEFYMPLGSVIATATLAAAGQITWLSPEGRAHYW